MNNAFEFGKVDWDYWSLKPFPSNWEVAGLVCNIPPDELNCFDDVRDLEFAPLDWCGKEQEFRKKLSLISENAPYAGFDASDYAGYGRVDMKEFLIWVKVRTKWALPPELDEIALGFVNEQAIKPQTLDEKVKPKSIREENNELRLIWALRTLLSTNGVYETNAGLIADLCEIHKGKEPFKKSTLETKFADAKRIFESD
jgi:hypothetical protein